MLLPSEIKILVANLDFVLRRNMKACCRTMTVILLSDLQTKHKPFVELERESAKMALMGRAARIAESVHTSEEIPDSAISEIRAVWAELQKWNVSSELSDAFQELEPIHVRADRRPPGCTTSI